MDRLFRASDSTQSRRESRPDRAAIEVFRNSTELAKARISFLSAMPPIATDPVCHIELSRSAISGLMQCSDLVALARKLSDSLVERDVSLFDHGLPFFRLGREQRG